MLAREPRAIEQRVRAVRAEWPAAQLLEHLTVASGAPGAVQCRTAASAPAGPHATRILPGYCVAGRGGSRLPFVLPTTCTSTVGSGLPDGNRRQATANCRSSDNSA